MAKPQIVTLPFVLLFGTTGLFRECASHRSRNMSHSSFAQRSFSFLVWEKLPLFILAAAGSIITVIAQHAGAAIRTTQEISVSARLKNVLVSYVRYLGKLFWPSQLAPMYPHPGDSLPGWQVVCAAALLLIVTALVLQRHDRRYLTVGWFWFLGTLIPMIGIVTVGEQAMADRFAYMPCIGLFVAVVWTLDRGSLQHSNSERVASRGGDSRSPRPRMPYLPPARLLARR